MLLKFYVQKSLVTSVHLLYIATAELKLTVTSVVVPFVAVRMLFSSEDLIL